MVKKSKTKILSLVVFGIIIASFLITRLYNLTLLPIFFDEANYIFWAKRIATGNAGWFLPLTYGKPVPYIWSLVLALKTFPTSDYLMVTRLLSVGFSLATLLGVYKLGAKVFNSHVGLAAALLFTLSPFAIFHDRLVLYDPLLSALCIWTVYYVIKTAETCKIRDAILWGIFLGGAILTKASAISFEILAPLAFLTLGKFKKVWLVGVAFLVSQIVANLQIVSTGYGDYLKKATDYTSTGNSFFVNLSLSASWLNAYLTSPILALATISLCYLMYKRPRLGIVFLLFSLGPVIGFSLVGRIYFPRYILFTLPYFLIPCAYLLSRIVRNYKLVLVVCLPLLLFSAIKFDYYLLTNPAKAPLPKIDRWQFVEGFPSGYGLQPIFDYVDKESQTKKIRLIIQGSFSHYPNAFFLEFWDNPNVVIEERWPLTKTQIETVDQGGTDPSSQEFVLRLANLKKYEYETYFVVRNNEWYQPKDVIKQLNLKSVVEGKKPGEMDSVYLARRKSK